MKKHYFFLLFLSTLINIIISSSLQAKNSHRLISLASGQIIHKYKSNLDTLVTKKVDTDEIKIQPNKIGRLQSALDTADEEIVVSNKIIDTSKRSIDSIQKVEIKKIKKYSNIVNASTVAVVVAIPILNKEDKNSSNNSNYNGVIYVLLFYAVIGLIGYSIAKISSSKANLKKGWTSQLSCWWKIGYFISSIFSKLYMFIGKAFVVFSAIIMAILYPLIIIYYFIKFR